MKQIITTLAIASVTLIGVTSCNTSAVKEKQAALEAQQKTIDSMKLEMAKQQVIDSMNEVARTQFVIPQVMPSAEVKQSVASTPRRKSTATRKRSTSRSSSVARAPRTSSSKWEGNNNSGNDNSGYSNNYPTQTQSQPVYTPPAPAPVPEKKGWSAKAKGAVIGAGVGAIGGAVINKQNRPKGAIIGGIIGAAGGLGAGAIIDRKNGR